MEYATSNNKSASHGDMQMGLQVGQNHQDTGMRTVRTDGVNQIAHADGHGDHGLDFRQNAKIFGSVRGSFMLYDNLPTRLSKLSNCPCRGRCRQASLSIWRLLDAELVL